MIVVCLYLKAVGIFLRCCQACENFLLKTENPLSICPDNCAVYTDHMEWASRRSKHLTVEVYSKCVDAENLDSEVNFQMGVRV